jgi:hypothetical protein
VKFYWGFKQLKSCGVLNFCISSFFSEITLETFLGDPRKPGTLHHFNSDGSKNDYEKAVSAIGSILAKYDSDKKFPVWGFGAKVRFSPIDICLIILKI